MYQCVPCVSMCMILCMIFIANPYRNQCDRTLFVHVVPLPKFFLLSRGLFVSRVQDTWLHLICITYP